MSAAEFIPERPTLKKLREAAAKLPRLPALAGADPDRVRRGSREGRADARRRGPGRPRGQGGAPVRRARAGRELDKAFEALGIERGEVYLTNAVKHFKFEERGKRRIHQTPKKAEVDACFPWLDTEIKLVKPRAIVTLGATAAKALHGSSFRLTQHRGERLDSDLAEIVAATIHPSLIVRNRDNEARQAEREAFVADLRAVVDALAS